MKGSVERDTKKTKRENGEARKRKYHVEAQMAPRALPLLWTRGHEHATVRAVNRPSRNDEGQSAEDTASSFEDTASSFENRAAVFPTQHADEAAEVRYQ